MDVTELVRTVVQEVLKHLQGEAEKKGVMILAERDIFLSAKIHECLGDEVELCYFGDETQGRTFCRYILPELSCADMADLATGRASGPVMAEVQRLLLLGVEVEGLRFGYKAYSETAPAALYRLYESYEKTLAGFGLKTFQPEQAAVVRLREILVTEKMIFDVQKQGASTLMVLVTARITPLAVETAQDLNINIQKCL